MAAPDDAAAANRPKRVRTGCLTCRERHLKCDEGLPECQNCRKSSRICKRGVRLNFIDTQVKQIPTVPVSHEWRVQFQDESREIASDYAGGVARYAAFSQQETTPPNSRMSPAGPTSSNVSVASVLPVSSQPALPPISLMAIEASEVPVITGPVYSEVMGNVKLQRTSDGFIPTTVPSSASLSSSSLSPHTLSPPPPIQKKDMKSYLDDPEETLFMQVFVEEVGLWMDSLDPQKHFSSLLPFTALQEPMLLNALLACGARHLTLVNPAYGEDKALNYYDTATRLLLNSLQSQTKDMEMCATTAVILNVYEIMSERARQRMNHIAGAMALIRECGWSARSTGIGGACFWLNVSMELLSCLHFNLSVSWDPEAWGVDMEFSNPELGQEELWAYRIIYVLARIANFRAGTSSKPLTSDQSFIYNETSKRAEEWEKLYDLCVQWNERIPRTMQPLAYLYQYQTAHKSAFPEIWLIKRCTIVARLFFHTAMVLLAGMHPLKSRDSPEMAEPALLHAHQICGITAHVKDRGVASVALRSLAIAAECLTIRREQEEVLVIFQKIKRETGWRVDFLLNELKEKWGWDIPQAAPPPPSLLTTPLLEQQPTPHHFASFQTAVASSSHPVQRQSSQTPQQVHLQYANFRRLPQMANSLITTTAELGSFHPQFVTAPPQHLEPRHQFL